MHKEPAACLDSAAPSQSRGGPGSLGAQRCMGSWPRAPWPPGFPSCTDAVLTPSGPPALAVRMGAVLWAVVGPVEQPPIL